MEIEDYINQGWRIYYWGRSYKPNMFGVKVLFVEQFKNLIFIK
jgi:hypothetical protein